MNWDDFYDDSCEFDQQVEEFKESLRIAVKKEFMDRMERLERDNAELREIRDNWDRKVQELQRECIRRETEAAKVMLEEKRIRFNELIAEVAPVAYAVKYRVTQPPKCSLCDEYRKREYITPLGKKAKEDCTCNVSFYDYYVKAVPAVELRYESEGIRYVNYLFNEEAQDRFSMLSGTLIDDKPFSLDNRYGAMFLSEEKAKAYAEWLNEKEREAKPWINTYLR